MGLRERVDRRMVVAGLAAGGLSACAGPLARQHTSAFIILSPAPEATPLHALNGDLVAAMRARPELAGTTLRAVALPQSINELDPLLAAERARQLPIVTAPDWPLARAGTGPDWHGYPKARPDLMFVSALYEVGFGIQALTPGIAKPADLIGRRIAAPPRPSAVRMLTEALVRDGWGLEAQVTIVDAQPPQVGALLRDGQVDATSWNLILPTPTGPAAMIGPLAVTPQRPMLPVSAPELARLNAANPFALTPVRLGGVEALSFRQGLAAWRDSDSVRLAALLRAIRDNPGRPGLPGSLVAMQDWPLKSGEMHPVAERFYATESRL